MDNVLLIFLNDLERVDEFNEIVDRFDKEGYKIYLLDNIKGDDYFSFDSLPLLVESYKEEHKSINKLVVLTNSRDLVFSWFRCYNSLVDDYIYFIDEDDKNYFIPSENHYNFYFNLTEFNGIENENIEGKIYLSKDDQKVLPICSGDKYFENLEAYNLLEERNKRVMNKKYKFNGYDYDLSYSRFGQGQIVKIGKINKRLVFIKGQSQYDVLRIISDYKTNFLEDLGFEVDLLDLLAEDAANNIKRNIIEKKCDLISASNSIGIDLKLTDGRNLYDALDIPFIGGLGDHPVNQLPRIINSPKKAYFSCLDEENLKYFEKYFPDKNISISNTSAYPIKNSKEKEFKDRDIEIWFAGSIIDPLEIQKSWRKLDKNLEMIIKEVSGHVVKQRPLMDIDDKISKTFLKYGIVNEDLNLRAVIHSSVERYIRYYQRYELIKKLGESDLEVLCIGNVDEYNKLNKSGTLIIKDKVDYETLLGMMGNSRMVLNITGHLYKGITERVLSAMINGAAVVTERDRFTESNFKNGENIILYDVDTVVDTIKHYRGKDQELEKIAMRGQKEAINKYDYRIGLSRLPRRIRTAQNL